MEITQEDLELLSNEALQDRLGLSVDGVRDLKRSRGIDIKLGCPIFWNGKWLREKLEAYNQTMRAEMFEEIKRQKGYWVPGMPTEDLKPGLKGFVEANMGNTQKRDAG